MVDMTFGDYINNPMGKQNAVISNREMYRSFYANKFNAMMLRENGKFKYTLYKDKENYVIHIKVPSETIKKFYYDVVIYFYSKDKTTPSSLENYNVKFYSNDPAFVYTFAHAFNKNKLLFNDLDSKMSKQALRERAREKNPKEEIGYVKTLYIAYLFMKNQNLFQKIKYVTASKYNKRDLISEVMSADEKIRLRQEAAQEEAEKKKPKKQEKREVRGNLSASNAIDLAVKTTKSIGAIGSIKTSPTTKRSKSTTKKR